jgi:hypothetical protein
MHGRLMDRVLRTEEGAAASVSGLAAYSKVMTSQITRFQPCRRSATPTARPKRLSSSLPPSFASGCCTVAFMADGGAQ